MLCRLCYIQLQRLLIGPILSYIMRNEKVIADVVYFDKCKSAKCYLNNENMLRVLNIRLGLYMLRVLNIRLGLYMLRVLNIRLGLYMLRVLNIRLGLYMLRVLNIRLGLYMLRVLNIRLGLYMRPFTLAHRRGAPFLDRHNMIQSSISFTN